KILDALTHVARLGNVGLTIGESEFHGLKLAMQGFGIIAMGGGKALQHTQCHERYQALTVGRNLPQLDAAVASRDRRYPLRLVICQVLGTQIAAGLPRKGIDALSQFASIETLALRL